MVQEANKNWNVDFDNLPKQIETNNNYKYLIRYLHKVIIPLLLILPKLSDYVRLFKDKNNILMSFGLNDDKLLGNYETIWSNIEDLHNFKSNTLLVFNDRYIKTQLRSSDYEFYTILCG